MDLGKVTQNDWRPELLRLTAFTIESANDTNWQSLVGTPPAERAEQPPLGRFQEVGPLGNGLLRLIREPARIEWRYEPLESNRELSSLGLLPEEMGFWIPHMSRWLANAPKLRRVAFGAVLLIEVPDKDTGYQLLSQQLPAIKLDPESSDFLYRINRPRQSSLDPAVRVNRLTTWSILSTVQLGMSIVGGQPLPPDIRQQSLACRLELDINTAPRFEGTFGRDRLPDVFDELVKLGMEIVEKGDIP